MSNKDYNSEPGIKLKMWQIILIIIIILVSIFGVGIFIMVEFNKNNGAEYITSIIESINSKNEDDDDDGGNGIIENNDSSDNVENGDERTKKSSDGKGIKSDDNGDVDYSKLTIEDYAKLCTDKTFGKTGNSDKSCFSKVVYNHNNYTIYIDIGLLRNKDELHKSALNASVELYKSLYTLYPEKFKNTLFGVYVSGSYVKENGTQSERDEVMFSWFDEKTLNAVDINKLNADNFKDYIYRYYDSYKKINIQKD